MGDSLKRFKDIFKPGRKNKSADQSGGSASREHTPSPNASIRGTSPPPTPSVGVSALVFQPFVPLPVSPSPGPRKADPATDRNDTWTNLTAFVSVLHRNHIFGPLAAVIDDLSWFIREHENVITVQEEYQELHTQLEALFKDLLVYFSSGTPPSMTTSMLNLCAAIGTELRQVYETQDRNAISRLLQAEHDLDKITSCYRRIQTHLERVMVNATLNILRMVDKQTTEAQLRQLNPSMSACYNSEEARVVQRRECTPNTRTQVLSDLNAWKDKLDGQKVCWMSGMAGTGKTTITNTLCSTLDQNYELGASFFCTRSLPTCRDVKLILPTIAYQLARFSDPFRGALVQVLDRDPDVHTKALRVQFQRMILEPLQNVKRGLPKNLVVVVDALDECDDGNGVEQILEVLLEKASDLPVKFLISSRPEYHIRHRIGRSVQKTQVTLHELEERIVKADIETYVRAEVVLLSIPLTREQLDTLVERAGVLFIYAATVIRYITDGDPLERLDTVLRAPDPGQGPSKKSQEIDKLYEAVLASAFGNPRLEPIEKKRMELVLRTVVCAQEPLTIEALSGLLDLSLTKVIAALRPLWSVLHISGQNTTDRVNILHASFPDYMLEPGRSGRFTCNSKLHHGKLAELCFRRISQNIPQFNICNLQSSYTLDEDIPDLDQRVKQAIPMDLLYACQYWAVHLCLGEKSDKRATELHDFLSKRLLLWIEVLNLTKRIEKSIGLVEQAMSWLRQTGRFSSTMILARDARRFTTMFATSPVSQSTPHLYVSMLASWPEHRLTSYTQRTTEVVHFNGIQAAERQLSLLSLIPAGYDVLCVSYSSDGRFFAAGTWDGRILIWDTTSCRMTIDPIIGHSNCVQAIAISPDGTRICSGSHDKTVRIWDPQNGQLVAGPLEGHRDSIWSVNYSPDAQWLVSGSSDGIVCIWSTNTWQRKSLVERDGIVHSAMFSLDGTMVAAGFGSLIYLWDPLTGQSKADPLKGHTGFIRSLAFLPDGKRLVSGSNDCTICIWDINSRQIVFGPFREHMSALSDIRVSPEGRWLISAAYDNTMLMWNTQTWQSRTLFRNAGLVTSIAFSPDGLRLVSGSSDWNVRIWEAEGFSDEQAVANGLNGHGDWVRSVAFSPCGTYLISGSDDMTLRIWDLQTKQLIGSSLKHNHGVLFVGVSADSEHIFAVTQDRMIHVWSKQAGVLEYTIGPIQTDGRDDILYRESWPADFSFDGRRTICGSESGRIYVQDDDRPARSSTGHDNAVYSIAFSSDGQSFASGASDGALIIWDSGTGEILFGPLAGHSGDVNSITFSTDGTMLASGSDDRTIRLWNPLKGTPVGRPLRGHTHIIYSVAFSHGGSHLVSGSEDMTVRVWDVMGGQSIAVFQGHTHVVESVVFSPDGTQIISGSGDTTIRIWNAPAQCHIDSEAPEEQPVNTEEVLSIEWDMDSDGWVRDAQNRLLVWVPPDLRTTLLRQQNSGLISRQGCIELEFINARIGDEWQTCYEPL